MMFSLTDKKGKINHTLHLEVNVNTEVWKKYTENNLKRGFKRNGTKIGKRFTILMTFLNQKRQTKKGQRSVLKPMKIEIW